MIVIIIPVIGNIIQEGCQIFKVIPNKIYRIVEMRRIIPEIESKIFDWCWDFFKPNSFSNESYIISPYMKKETAIATIEKKIGKYKPKELNSCKQIIIIGDAIVKKIPADIKWIYFFP